MKKKPFSSFLLLASIFFLSTSSFAQTVPGGSGDGSGGVIDSGPGGGTVYDCPISYSLKRNNGNGWAVCNGDGQIRIAFSQLPTEIPQLTGIFYKANKITTINYPVDGDVSDPTLPYISYCLTGGNIPPAKQLTFQFTYPNGQVCTTDTEADN
ncbi:MAG TPA: hypothetical protein VIM07_17780 [Chitinophagaceae bacterium]